MSDLLSRAKEIKNATEIGENTAERVGGVMVDTINEITSLQERAVNHEDTLTTHGKQITALQTKVQDVMYTNTEQQTAINSQGTRLTEVEHRADEHGTQIAQINTDMKQMDDNILRHGEEIEDLQEEKQDKLVSGVTIKAINGESILGGGDITIQGGGNSQYTLVLNKTFSEDVATYDVADDVPNITSYSDFIIAVQFKFQDGINRGGWNFIMLNGENMPKIYADKLVQESYRTHYVFRVHIGNGVDKTAYIECHNDSFYNPQYNDGNQGLNFMLSMNFSSSSSNFTTFIFGHGFIAGEKLQLYAR